MSRTFGFWVVLIYFLAGYTAQTRAQDTVRVFYDKDWAETTQNKAEYYRKAFRDGDSSWAVTDFYKNGKVQMKGHCTNRDLKTKTGPFQYYYKSGKLSATVSYVNGKKSGVYRAWDEDEPDKFNQMGLYSADSMIYRSDSIWGKAVEDPYCWMEKIQSPRTLGWLAEQDELCRRSKGNACRSIRLSAETYSTVYTEDVSRKGDYYFKVYIEHNSSSPVLYYAKRYGQSMNRLFDPGQLSKTKVVELDDFEVSEDNKTLALVLDENGGDWKTVRFMDMNSLKLLPDTLEHMKYSKLFWYRKGVLYAKYDVRDTRESFKGIIKGRSLYYHRLGTAQADDLLVYKDKNEYADFEFSVTPEKKYLSIEKRDSMYNVISIASLDQRMKPDFHNMIITRSKESYYEVLGELNGKLLVSSNLNAPNGAIYFYDPGALNQGGLFFPEHKQLLRAVSIRGNKLLCLYEDDKHSMLVVLDSLAKNVCTWELPDGFEVTHLSEADAEGNVVFSFASFYSPRSAYRINLNSCTAWPAGFGETEIFFNDKDMITEKVHYPSKDGTMIPMYITHRKDVFPDRNTPTLLYGYGGFGIPSLPSFVGSRMVFLKNGGVLAVPCLRGGGDFPGWHEKGMRLHKQNTFDDFTAAAEFLIRNNLTNASKLAAMGGSNGGLVVGAAMTQRPELFKAAVSYSGVLDMIREFQYNIGYLYSEEYGSIRDSADFKNMLGYSPVQHVKTGVNYPATLLIAGDNDDRVMPFNSFKFQAELLEKSAGNNPHILYYRSQAGHSGNNLKNEWLDQEAYVYSFLFDQLGMKNIR